MTALSDGGLTATPEELCDAFAQRLSADLLRRLAKNKIRLEDEDQAGIEFLGELAARLVILWFHLVHISGLSTKDKREFIELSNELETALCCLDKRAIAGSNLAKIARTANATVGALLDQLPPGPVWMR